MGTDSDSKPFGRYDEWLRLLAAFILTGVVGAIISVYLQGRSWRHQRALALCDQEKKAATEFENKISDVMDRRLWSLRGFVDRLDETGKLASAGDEWKAYREGVAEWNVILNKNRILLRRYFGQRVSDEFMSSIHLDGFRKLNTELNAIIYEPKIDREKVMEEKNAIDAFNPTVYSFDDKLLDQIQKDATPTCRSPDLVKQAPPP